MFGNKITKTFTVSGMACAHCAAKVENSLKSLKEALSRIERFVKRHDGKAE